MQPLRSCSPKRREGGINMPRRSISRRRPVAILATIALTLVSTGPARADTLPPLRMMTYNANAGDLVRGKTRRVSQRLTRDNWTTICGEEN
jgi:hypothetical protein